jgi:hypothetical protein
MTLDKFGKHLHNEYSHSKLFVVEDISKLKYETSLLILGEKTSNDTDYYKLMNGLYEYIFQFPSATITHVNLSPNIAKIVINEKEYYSTSLVGKSLKYGDRILVKIDTPPLNKYLCLELHLQVFLVNQNEI